MIRTTIEKSIYQPFEYIGENVFRIMFDKKDLMGDIRNENEEPTSEQNETDYCTVLMEYFYYQPSVEFMSNFLSNAVGTVNMQEAQYILSNLDNNITNNLKEIMIRNILNYDSSTDVNSFTIQGETMWIDKATRVGLKMRFQAEKDGGKNDTTLWSNDGHNFTLEIDSAMSMLYELEKYASKCYDMTMQHVSNVKQLVSDDEIIYYDFKMGYPDKLVF